MKITFTPVGVSFSDTAPNILLLKSGSQVSFEHRPAFYGTGDNIKEYPNAVVVLFEGKKVGSLAESFLPESPQQVILKMIKLGESPIGTVSELIIPSGTNTFKRTYKLSVQVPEVIVQDKSIVVKKSWNEEGVKVVYNDLAHTYTNEGKELVPVTKYIKKFFKEFDAIAVSKTCENSWGVSQKDILNLWESNKDLSALFGTAIHRALEHYETHKSVGQIISDKRDTGENYALPKHPLLKSIIQEFVAINPIKGEVITEVLLSDVSIGICGHADRVVILDWDKKIARIGDYKINVEADVKSSKDKVLPPFDYLPSTKISKYQLQLSVYANMLQRCGWEVTGLDVYVFEGGWKYYPLEVLKVL